MCDEQTTKTLRHLISFQIFLMAYIIAFGTGAAITLFSSFFPGASTVASMSSRSAYYGVRTANAFYNLAARDVILYLTPSKFCYGWQPGQKFKFSQN